MQVDPYKLKFGDKKPLKGQDLFNCRGHADPFGGEREPIYVDLDFRNTYKTIGICGIARDTMPLCTRCMMASTMQLFFHILSLSLLLVAFCGAGMCLY